MISAIVLAGGASRRFGSDKTRAVLDGRLLLERVLAAVHPLVEGSVVIGPWAPEGVRHVIEPERFEGPLQALAFGMHQVSTDSVIVLGGDHPLLQPALLDHLIEEFRGPRSHGALIPLGPGGAQPLIACYDRSVLETAEQLLAAGERRLLSLVEKLEVRWVEKTEWAEFDPMGLSFMDVDTQSDLERIERLRPAPDRRSGPQRDQFNL